MIFDAQWPKTTPFHKAIGPLFHSEIPPFVMLRTSKSDTIVGLKPGQEENLNARDPQWLVNGRWGMIQFYKGKEYCVMN